MVTQWMIMTTTNRLLRQLQYLFCECVFWWQLRLSWLLLSAAHRDRRNDTAATDSTATGASIGRFKERDRV